MSRSVFEVEENFAVSSLVGHYESLVGHYENKILQKYEYNEVDEEVLVFRRVVNAPH